MRIRRPFGSVWLATVLLAACASPGDAPEHVSTGETAMLESAGESEEMNENERVILEFIEAWSRLDPAELAGFFAEDGIYHNMPSEPVQGRANVEELIRGFTASWTQTTWDVRTIVGKGNVIIAERLDRTQAGEKSVDLPCVGVFELEDGKIKVWRDYFDMGTYVRAMS